MRKWSRIFGFICTVICVWLVFSNYIIAGEYSEDNNYKVLFISSYSESYITVSDQIEGINNIFEGEDVEVDIEYMDSKRFSSEENIQNFYDTLKYKLENTYQYDAVIVGDDTALQFAMDYQSELFDDIPIVFFGINDYDLAVSAEENDYMTGFFEKTCVEDNIELATEMFPDTKNIILIVDGSVTGIADEAQFEAAEKEFADYNFRTINSEDYTYDELKVLFQKFEDDTDTIAFFYSINNDINGDYMELDEQFDFINEYLDIPVFRVNTGGVGSGILGGEMIDYVAMGENAANTVMDLLDGDSIEEMNLVEETPYYYIFDNNLLEEYDIDLDSIESISDDLKITLVNQDESFYEENEAFFHKLFIGFGFIAVVILILIIDDIRRRKIYKALQSSNEELLQTYEELSASEEELKSQYLIIEQQSSEVRLLNMRYETAIQSTKSAVWEMDMDSKCVEISSNFESMFGRIIPLKCDVYELLTKITDKTNQKNILNKVQQYIENKIDEINIRVPVTDEKNNSRWMLIRGQGITNEQKEIVQLSGICLDITDAKNNEEYIEYYAKHDFLTELPNRMDFERALQEELDNDKHGALLMLDLDNFKSINDTLGHTFGDEILKQVAERIKNACSNRFYAARMGGDEFLLLLKNIKNEKEVIHELFKLSDIFDQKFIYDGIEEYIKFSIGITFYPFDSNNINQLIINADAAMYKVKKNGKNNYAFYQEKMKKEINEKKKIENILRQNSKEKNFELVYQPQVDMNSGNIVGFEALIRMSNFSLGPDVFIPIAEETGDIIEIGRWVAKEAVSQMADWKKRGFEEKTMSINYSVKQLRDKEFLNYLQDLLNEYDISPGNLEIEVTEGILMENDIDTKNFLNNIRELGMKLALDDFGSGYSSLSYLTYIPANKLKLDKSINERFLDFENIKVMESIISLAHGLSLTITAEGIEEREKFDKLKKCGCDYLQGYLFSKPLKPHEIEKIYYSTYNVD